MISSTLEDKVEVLSCADAIAIVLGTEIKEKK